MGKKILSFDGGGIRGVIPAYFLQKLEEATGIRLAETTDLLAGTSTGSIIAGALALGMKSEEIVNFYLQKSQEIFSEKHDIIDKFLGLKARFSSQNLYNALQSAFQSQGADPTIALSQLRQQIVIPAVNLDNVKLHRWEAVVMTNQTDVSLIDAMMRSSAAPTYFPSYQGYVDGGMAANDPSTLACASLEAREDVALLSFGTGYTESNIPKGEHWGVLSWIMDLDPKSPATKTPLFTMLFDVQDELPGQTCRMLLGENYRRINLKLTESVGLDDAKKIPELIQHVDDYIAQNLKEWENTCEWVTAQFGER
jgi:patatin-like phospholipase/acyl hydrolase